MNDQPTITSGSAENAMPSNTKLASALAYVLFFIPWFFGKQHDPVVRHHINQAFGLFLFGFFLQGVLTTLIVWAGMLGIVGVSGILVWVARAIYVALAIYGIRNAWFDREAPLPWVGRYFPVFFSPKG